jgi:hypothetical protein
MISPQRKMSVAERQGAVGTPPSAAATGVASDRLPHFPRCSEFVARRPSGEFWCPLRATVVPLGERRIAVSYRPPHAPTLVEDSPSTASLSGVSFPSQ